MKDPDVFSGVRPRPGRLIDQAWQYGLRLGYACARQWWSLRRPGHQGVIVAIWYDGKILGVRQSYQDSLTWPGGGLRPREDPREAACRELEEELGLQVRSEDLVAAGEMTRLWHGRDDHVRVFELTLQQLPELRLDNREIVAVRFLPPEVMLRLSPTPFVAAYLHRCLQPSLPASS